MKRRIPILILVLAALGAGYYYYLYPRWAAKAAPANALKVSGNIEAHESVVGFKVPGRIVDLPIEEGQWVDKGALIAQLDSDDYRQQVAMDEASLHVQRRQLDLGLAGTRQQEIRAAEQVLLDAKADLEQKKLDFTRADTLYRQQVGSQMERDQAETNLKRAQAAVDRAQQQYDQALEGTRREQLAIDRASVAQAEQKLRLSRISLDYTTLRAPKAGVILVWLRSGIWTISGCVPTSTRPILAAFAGVRVRSFVPTLTRARASAGEFRSFPKKRNSLLRACKPSRSA
jgi:membrane fusion protein YbhG